MRSVLTKERTAPIVCNVRESGTTSNPNAGDKLRRYTRLFFAYLALGVGHGTSHAEGAKDCNEENTG
jgi:hypothetical protein